MIDVSNLQILYPKLLPYLPQVLEYLAGKRFDFEFEIPDFKTDFTKRVTCEIMKIPFGKTKTYGEIAQLSGFPMAFRAVGTLCARNELLILIPCHRVISASGFGEYALGLDSKKYLLSHEAGLI